MKLVTLVALGVATRCAHSLDVRCSDRTRCLNQHACSEDDALYRSGHLCASFPYYNGGAPFSGSLEWIQRSEMAVCNNSDSGTCTSWFSYRAHGAGTSALYGNCTRYNSSVGLCGEWDVFHMTSDLCSDGEAAFPWQGYGIAQLVPQCCAVGVCGGGPCRHCRAAATQVQQTQCRCLNHTLRSSLGELHATCSEWTCHAAPHTTTTFRCLHEHTDRPVCLAWSGVTDSTDYFEFAECSCGGLGEPGGPCLQWGCNYRQLSYHAVSPGWLVFGSVLGVTILICSAAVMAYKPNNRLWLTATLVTTLLVESVCVLLPATLRGGVPVLLITTAILVVASVLLAAGLVVRQKLASKAQAGKVVGKPVAKQILPVAVPQKDRSREYHTTDNGSSEGSQLA